MFRRKKNGTSEADGGDDDVAAAERGVEAPAPESVAAEPRPSQAEGPDGDQTADGNGAAEEAPAPAPAAVRSGNGDDGPGYVDDYLPPRVWVESVLDTRPPPSRDELERQAAADFEAAIAASLEGLREVVPDASSPDEARRVLEERQGDALPDPEGERLRAHDLFRTEASVHYRIQKQLERPRGRVGWGRPWEPPAGLARQETDSGRRSMPRGQS